MPVLRLGNGWDELPCFLNTMTLQFDAFSFKKFSEVNLETAEICSAKETGLLASALMSSAWKKPPAQLLFTESPKESPWGSFRRGFMTRRNKQGESIDPWRTPRFRAWRVRTDPDWVLLDCYNFHTSCTADAMFLNWCHAASNSRWRRTGISTESKAFCRSYRYVYTLLPSEMYLLITSCVAKIASALYADWLMCMRPASVKRGCILLRIRHSKSVEITEFRVIPLYLLTSRGSLPFPL